MNHRRFLLGLCGGLAAVTGVLAGCAGSSSIGRTDRTITINPAGGRIAIPNSPVTIIVPPGAVSAPVTLSAEPLPNPTEPPPNVTALPNSGARIGNITFATEVTVEISYANLGVLPGAEDRIRICRRPDAAPQWHVLSTTVDTTSRVATARTRSFSGFCIGIADEDTPLVTILPQGGAFAFPGTALTFVAPAGAVSTPTTVSATPLPSPNDLPGGAVPVGLSAFRISPITFGAPVGAQFNVSNLGVLPSDQPRARVFRRAGPGTAWQMLNTMYDPESGTVTASTTTPGDLVVGLVN